METSPGISDIHRAFVDGQLTATEIVRQVLERCEAAQALNAVISQDAALLLDAAQKLDDRRARGAQPRLLEAVPVLVKDNIDTCDYPTSAGTAALAGDVPQQDATAVRRLREAGALIAGKTNLYELAVGGDGSNRHFGDVKNPWEPSRSPGGSSGGSAAAVSARLVPASLGTDTNGSVRMPAAHCGVAGFRPSFERYPDDGIIPALPTRDSVGIFTNGVEDLHLLDQVLSGTRYALPEISLKGLRLLRPRGHCETGIDEDTRLAMEDIIAQLRAQGVTIIDTTITGLSTLVPQAAWALSAYELIRDLPGYLSHRGTSVDIDAITAGIALPLAAQRFRPQADNAGQLEQLRQAHHEAMTLLRPRIQGILASQFERHEAVAMVYPTMPFVALPAGFDSDTAAAGDDASGTSITHNMLHQSVAGIPSLTLPARLDGQGLPIGLGFDGPMGSDAQLLGIGRAFERMRGAFPAPPLAVG